MLKTPLQRMTGLFCITLLIILTTGCNTLEGAGRDIQKAGEALESSADGGE